MQLEPRQPRHHDKAHLKFVRGLPCCICGKPAPSEAAHIRMGCIETGKKPTGMGEKPSDAWVSPLCAYHHRTGILAQHKISESRFWFEIHGKNPLEIAARLWIESGGAARALEPKPVKRAAPTAERKPREQRVKMQSRQTFPPGRKLQSRGFERRPA